ncbi:MAG: hypothetical protein KGJ07_07760, partial [Patescibacteria group bacterium]|nr:hypothetical protein [Patescibacteria group bacterium]
MTTEFFDYIAFLHGKTVVSDRIELFKEFDILLNNLKKELKTFIRTRHVKYEIQDDPGPFQIILRTSKIGAMENIREKNIHRSISGSTRRPAIEGDIKFLNDLRNHASLNLGRIYINFQS